MQNVLLGEENFFSSNRKVCHFSFTLIYTKHTEKQLEFTNYNLHWSCFTCSSFPYLAPFSGNLDWESDEQTSSQVGQAVCAYLSD